MTNEKKRDRDGVPIDWKQNDEDTQELVNKTADINGMAISRRDIEEAAAKAAADAGQGGA